MLTKTTTLLQEIDLHIKNPYKKKTQNLSPIIIILKSNGHGLSVRKENCQNFIILVFLIAHNLIITCSQTMNNDDDCDWNEK